MRTIPMVVSLAILLTLFSLNAQKMSAQNCKADLVVEKNRTVKSADENGATYWLELTNRSPFETSFSIATRNLETSCSNNNRNTSEPNVNLNTVLYASDGRSSLPGTIAVSGGQTYRFRIDVSVPAGTMYNRWSCIEVQANSNGCEQGEVSTTLRVYVPDPTDE